MRFHTLGSSAGRGTYTVHLSCDKEFFDEFLSQRGYTYSEPYGTASIVFNEPFECHKEFIALTSICAKASSTGAAHNISSSGRRRDQLKSRHHPVPSAQTRTKPVYDQKPRVAHARFPPPIPRGGFASLPPGVKVIEYEKPLPSHLLSEPPTGVQTSEAVGNETDVLEPTKLATGTPGQGTVTAERLTSSRQIPLTAFGDISQKPTATTVVGVVELLRRHRFDVVLCEDRYIACRHQFSGTTLFVKLIERGYSKSASTLRGIHFSYDSFTRLVGDMDRFWSRRVRVIGLDTDVLTAFGWHAHYHRNVREAALERSVVGIGSTHVLRVLQWLKNAWRTHPTHRQYLPAVEQDWQWVHGDFRRVPYQSEKYRLESQLLKEFQSLMVRDPRVRQTVLGNRVDRVLIVSL